MFFLGSNRVKYFGLKQITKVYITPQPRIVIVEDAESVATQSNQSLLSISGERIFVKDPVPEGMQKVATSMGETLYTYVGERVLTEDNIEIYN